MDNAFHTPFPQTSEEPRKKQTVILWGREGLLVSGFEMVLKSHLDWEVIRMIDEREDDVLFRKTLALKPDVVLIDSSRSDCDHEIRLYALLARAHPGVTVITFNLESNLAEIYHKQQVQVTEITALLEIIARHSTSLED